MNWIDVTIIMVKKVNMNYVLNFLINVTIVGVSFLIALVIGEVIIRFYEPKRIQTSIDDPVLKYRNIDPAWDARGWNNDDALEGTDIVVFGDSMTQGQGTEKRSDAWPQQLENISSMTVYQMARGGYGPVQYAKLAEDAIPLRPKVAIVGFYVGNDLFDAYDTAYHLDYWKKLRDPIFKDEQASKSDVGDASLRRAAHAGAPEGTLRYMIYSARLWMRSHVRVYALFGDATRSLREKLGLARTQLENAADLSRLDPKSIYTYDKEPEIATVLSPQYRFEAIDLAHPSTNEGWRITKNRFLRMKEIFGTSTEFVIVEIPTKEAVYMDYLRAKDGTIPQQFDAYIVKENELHQSVRDFCIEEKLHCFSLRASLVEALNQKRAIYKPLMDGHPPKEGYRVFAESIYNYLKNEKLLLAQ